MPRSGWYLVGLTTFVFTMTIIVVYMVGYLGSLSWNRSALKSSCQIVNHVAYGENCYDPVGCQCYYSCFDVFIVVNFTIKTGEQVLAQIQVEDDEVDEQNALEDVARDYPLDSSLPCWYSSGNSTDVRLSIKSELTYAIVLSVLGALFAVCLLLEFLLCCKRKKKKTKKTSREKPVVSMLVNDTSSPEDDTPLGPIAEEDSSSSLHSSV